MHRGCSCTVVSAPAECFLVCLCRQPGCCRRRRSSWTLRVPSFGVCCPDSYVPTGGFIPSLHPQSPRVKHCSCLSPFRVTTTSYLRMEGRRPQAALSLPLAHFGRLQEADSRKVGRRRKRCWCFRGPFWAATTHHPGATSTASGAALYVPHGRAKGSGWAGWGEDTALGGRQDTSVAAVWRVGRGGVERRRWRCAKRQCARVHKRLC